MKNIYNILFKYVDNIKIIDAHEHFIGEKQHTKRYLSFFDYFFSYVQWDMHSAGMPAQYLRNHPKDEKQAIKMFNEIQPYWELAKYGSYAKPVILSLKKFHGVSDFTSESIIKIGNDLNENNKSGHYDKVFDICNIESIINQSPDNDYSDTRFIYGTCHPGSVQEEVEKFLKKNSDVTLDEYINYLDKTIEKEVEKKSKLIKFFSTDFLLPYNKVKAEKEFILLQNNENVDTPSYLETYIQHKRLELCSKHDLVAAVHTGVWNDITKMSPEWLFPVVEKHRDTVFDIYHMGMPYVRQCAFLAKNYQNVYVNLCWSHCVSSEMTKLSIQEYLDIVPINKIFGFGGDVFTLPEQVWGQRQLALDNLCQAFALRIKNELMDIESAKHILKLWLYDNPKEVYKI